MVDRVSLLAFLSQITLTVYFKVEMVDLSFKVALAEKVYVPGLEYWT